MNVEKLAANIFAEAAAVKDAVTEEHFNVIARIATTIAQTLKEGGSIYTMGNGGSAADAQHMACEMLGRFKKERSGLPVMSLTADTMTLTAIGNDFGYQAIFARQLEALAKPGDVVVGLSTSGNSPNVLAGLAVAKEFGAVTVGFTGSKGGQMKSVCDIHFAAPSEDTPRIQECHTIAIHIICELVEELMDNS